MCNVNKIAFLAVIGEKEFKLNCVKLGVYRNGPRERFLAIHHIKTVHKSGGEFFA